jgi:hypothetical protein
LLEKLVSDWRSVVTDAEVPQEILHQVVASERRAAVQPAFDALLNLIDQLLPVGQFVVERAKQLVLAYRQLSARDARASGRPAASWNRRILTLDSGFGGSPGGHTPVLKSLAAFALLRQDQAARGGQKQHREEPFRFESQGTFAHALHM